MIDWRADFNSLVRETMEYTKSARTDPPATSAPIAICGRQVSVPLLPCPTSLG